MINKKILITLILIFFSLNYLYASENDLNEFNEKRNQINKNAMLTLGSWAIGNIALNSALIRSGERDRKYFYQMNIAWNTVNLAIAGFGLYGALHPNMNLTLFESIKQQSNIEKILLFNAGLDVGYMMTGFYLIEKSKNSTKCEYRLKGYGKSLLLQGGFLFLFDLTVYFIHTGNHELMQKLLSHVIINNSSIGFAFYL